MGQKWEREIQELLERMEDRPPRKSGRDRGRPKGDLRRRGDGPTKGSRDSLPIPTGAILLFGGLALVIVAAFVNGYSAELARLMAIAGVVLFLSPIVVARRVGGQPKKWRGKIIEVRPRSPLYHYWQRIRRLFNRNRPPW